MPNLNPSSPVWLFDLDNTLHDASHAIFPANIRRMNDYIAQVLGDGVTPASLAEVEALRMAYWRRYGATLLGMIRHHDVRAADFLRETHAIGELGDMIRAEAALAQLLRRLPGRKVLLTNAPQRYSNDVLRHLGLARHFSHHIAIEDMHVHRQLRPKPSGLMLRRLLRRHQLAPQRCILVEDTLENLKSARRLGVRTVWLTRYLRAGSPGMPARATAKRPPYVDVKVKSLRQLPRHLHRLLQKPSRHHLNV
ncbi:MAG: pyrimidine 5'-nucleotidase [Gammaproteobacteria bacterium]